MSTAQAKQAVLAATATTAYPPPPEAAPLLRAQRPAPQSACLRRNAGISISSMPLDDGASTLAAAWVRALRQTLGVLSAP